MQKSETSKVKLENKLKAIYAEKGYLIDCDNRSYFTKSINKALTNPNVRFDLCEKGFVFKREKDGFRFNLRIHISGKGKLFKLTNFDPESICEAFARVTQMPHVKESINIHQDACECSKCRGKGIIPAFMHVCKGVCFDCLGIGYRFRSGNW